MPYPYTLKGKTIQETYDRLLQIVSSSIKDGLGAPVNVLQATASFAETASYAYFQISNEWSASWSSASLSSSHALRADNADTASYTPSSLTSSYSLATNVTMSTPINVLYDITVDSGSIVPSQDVAFNLGAADRRWRNGWIDSLNGTASWAWNAFTASQALYANSASHALFADSASHSEFSDTASHALYADSSSHANRTDLADTASWASMSFSGTFADVSRFSWTTNGINVELAAPDLSTTSSTYPSVVVSSAATNETHPHAVAKIGNKIFVGGWDHNLYRINDPDGNLSDITTASFIYVRDASQVAVAQSASVTQLYFLMGGDFAGIVPDAARIIKVDPTTLSQSSFYYPINNNTPGIAGYGLPPIVSDGTYLYVSDVEGHFLKIDASTGTLVANATGSLMGAHASTMDSSNTFFLTTTGGGSITRVNCSDLSFTTASLGVGSITDDFAIIGDYAYPCCEGALYLVKVHKNTLSSSLVYAYMNAFGTFTEGTHLYMGVYSPASEIWVYPYGNETLGPIRFTVSGIPNEMSFTNGGKAWASGWLGSTMYTYYLPILQVGINKQPEADLDVASTIRSLYGNFTTQVNTNTLRFTGSIISATTSSAVIISSTGTARINSVTASVGLRTPFISASVIQASASIGFLGTASWARNAITSGFADFSTSASYATQAFASTYAGTATFAWESDVAVSSSWASSSLSSSYAVRTSNADNATNAVNSQTASMTSGTASFANFAWSASWAPIDPATTAVSASWASSSFTSSYAVKASTADNATNATNAQTSSWAISASWASSSYSSSYAVKASNADSAAFWDSSSIVTALNTKVNVTNSVLSGSINMYGATVNVYGTILPNTVTATTVGSTYGNFDVLYVVDVITASLISCSVITASQMNGTASYANFAKSASWAPASGVTAIAESASWASSSYTASFLPNGVYQITSAYSQFAPQSTIAQSASWASASFTSSYAVSASWADNTGTVISASWADRAGTSSFAVSAWTASYAMNGGTGNFPASVTQSSFEIHPRDWLAEASAAFDGNVGATLIGSYIGNYSNASYPLSSMLLWYLNFPYNTGGGTTGSAACYQMKMPQSYVGGLTSSFQFFTRGNGLTDGPGTNTAVYWEMNLFALTGSNGTQADLFIAPILVEQKYATSSVVAGPTDSGSVFNLTFNFTGSSTYLNPNSIIFLNLRRISPWDFTNATTGSDVEYSSSVGLLSSRLNWNAA